MLLSSPTVHQPSSPSPSASLPHSPRLFSSSTAAPSPVLLRYGVHRPHAEQRPVAAIHDVPAGIVRMRLSQFLNLYHQQQQRRPPHQQHQHQQYSPYAMLQSRSQDWPAPFSPSFLSPQPASTSASSPAQTASSVSAIIAAWNDRISSSVSGSGSASSRRGTSWQPTDDEQQSGRVKQLADSFLKQRSHSSHPSHPQRAAAAQPTGSSSLHRKPSAASSSPLPRAAAIVRAARPPPLHEAAVVLRRRYSADSRLPASVAAALSGESSLLHLRPSPLSSQRSFPRSCMRRLRLDSASASSRAEARVRFRRSLLLREHRRQQGGSGGVPRQGAASLGLDWIIERQTRRRWREKDRQAATDEACSSPAPRRRYPCANPNEELQRLTEQQRSDILKQHDAQQLRVGQQRQTTGHCSL